jgi:cytochrome c biogenesis protein CcmG, thiol:disulfide interchange protein DsbE
MVGDRKDVGLPPRRSPRGLRLSAWLALGAAGLAALVIFGLVSVHSSVGRTAPALPHERLAGAPVSLAALLREGRGGPVLITFWASWCGPCAREAAALERFSLTPPGHGRLVGVDWSDSLPGARSFIRHYRWTFSNLRDAEGTVGNNYRLIGLPTTFVVDSSGHIRAVLRGPQNDDSLTRAVRG